MRRTFVLLLCTVAATATAWASDPDAAAKYFALGSLVYGVCPKYGYSVDPNAWHSLSSSEIPTETYDPSLFTSGGKYASQTSKELSKLKSVMAENGEIRLCLDTYKWALQNKAQLGDQLIKAP